MAGQIRNIAYGAAVGHTSVSDWQRRPVRRRTWRGASGKGYVHSVYSLIECPPLPQANFILVRRDERGRRAALHIGVSQNEAPSLNLAQVRQRGAQLGANEVHVYVPDRAADAARFVVACDLRAGQFGSLDAEPQRVRAAGQISIRSR